LKKEELVEVALDNDVLIIDSNKQPSVAAAATEGIRM